MSDLYESDILDWSEHQAALLRRIAAGERSNDESPDWPNIIEEIESVGRSQLSAVRSLLVQALLHDLKATAWPLSREMPHWRAEARGLRGDAADALTPSMRQRIEMAALYQRALDRLPDSMDEEPPQPVPSNCPLTLDELLGIRTAFGGRTSS